ncbi:cytochrome c biogenesis protein CcdA [Halovulum dunhuangense]|uniref:Cytochrome c biogenesis protein CcdA n=1 Tax=Halovulum dunhuangense TaxID=1505036 RepID=A0A849KXG4_9RHOB|nr:cytochrome c biogenesis protein CcdA [Halovulum dunhuangense]NNU79247.1 cytochrome c biogenesis protein CcdA [Halovulum dunhuangense]
MFDISYAGAGFAGLLSFLSPCILPIVPFYLSYMAGVSINQANADGTLTPAVRRKAILGAVFFAAGVITIFMGLGATASLFGQMVREWFTVLKYAAAAIIFAMGLHFLGVIRIGILYRQLRADSAGSTSWGLVGSFVIGMAFAFGWTPCVGPVLAAILFTAAAEESARQGAMLLFVYGAGMTFPFILAAAFIGPFIRFSQRFRRHLGLIEKGMGVFLILFAVLIATDSINYIAQWMLSIAPDIGVLR